MIEFTEEGAEGSITYLYNIQAMKSGKFLVYSPSISYFDPEQERYITIKTKEFNLQVQGVNQPQVLAQTTLKEESKVANAEQVIVSKPKPNRRSIALIVGIAAPLSALSLFLLIRRKRKSPQQEDLQAAKNNCLVKATQKINYWKEAESAVDDQNQFAVLLPKAIIQELENRFKFPCISRDKAFASLKDSHPEQAQQLREIIDECDHFRYGFSSINLNTSNLLKQTEAILGKIK